jgi:hypothetical protein
MPSVCNIELSAAYSSWTYYLLYHFSLGIFLNLSFPYDLINIFVEEPLINGVFKPRFCHPF